MLLDIIAKNLFLYFVAYERFYEQKIFSVADNKFFFLVFFSNPQNYEAAKKCFRE